MDEPPVDIANFRARAHAIAAEKRAKRHAGPPNSNEPKDNRRKSSPAARATSHRSRFHGSGNIGSRAASFTS